MNSKSFLFASEIRALFIAGVPRTVDMESLEELLIFRYVAGENTPFRGIKRLLPGHYLEIYEGKMNNIQYWRAAEYLDNDPSYIEVWKERFTKAVNDQKISDVPLGTLLSGGLDSSTVTANLARTESSSIKTFTVSVPPEEGLDEWPYAEEVARQWKCKSFKVQIPTGDVLKRLRIAQSYHDEPFAYGNDMHIYEVSRLAKQHVTVLLSGEGGDETLGGYTRYEPVRYPIFIKFGTSNFGFPLRYILGLSSKQNMQNLRLLLSLNNLYEVMLYNPARIVPDDLQRIGYRLHNEFHVRRSILDEAIQVVKEPIKQLMLYEIQTFLCSVLDRNDRMTMASSIECRVPFLGVKVVEAALRLPVNALFSGRAGKKILRDYANRLLPQKILNRPKWGLGIPWLRYFREDLMCREFISNFHKSELANVLGVQGLGNLINNFLAGDNKNFQLVYQFFTLAIWWEQIVNKREDKKVNIV